jgi:hypothetical protein
MEAAVCSHDQRHQAIPSLITCKMRQHFKTITAVGFEHGVRSDGLTNG